MTTTPTWEYYAFLGVTPEADDEEIRRAGARKRRELEIARDTAAKAHLNEVLQTLRDPEARAAYDAMQRGGETLLNLVMEAKACSDDEEWPGAIRLYKQALELAPGHPLLRNALAFCQAGNGNFREAQKLYQQLVKEFPSTSLYWASYGLTCLQLARQVVNPPRGTPRCTRSACRAASRWRI